MLYYSKLHHRKKKNKFKIVFIAILIIGFLYIIYPASGPTIDSNIIKDQVNLSYKSKYNFRMDGNKCGPYSVATVYRILKGEEIDSDELYNESDYKLGKKGNLPWGVENLLDNYGIKYESPNLSDLSDNEKLQYLSQELSLGRPIIILGCREGGYEKQHYITILGFDKNEDVFYIYDSWFKKGEGNLTADSNGDLPGNRNFTSDELLEFWGRGGILGMYKRYAISCHL